MAPRPVRAFAFVLVAALAAAACSDSEDAGPTFTVDLGQGAIEVQTVDGLADAAGVVDTVVMVGDSITKGSLPALESRFADLGLDAAIVADNGKRMAVAASNNPSGVDVTAFLAADESRDRAREVWVIALGTNDAGQYSSADQYAAAVNAVLAEVPDDAALVWVDTYIANRTDDTDEVNRVIHERVRRRGNAAIVPWSVVAPGPGVLSGDAVHPTAAGAEVFATLVADSVATFVGR